MKKHRTVSFSIWRTLPKKCLGIIMLTVITCSLLTGCGSSKECDEIYNYVLGKSYYDLQTNSEEKHNEEFASSVDGKKHQGGAYTETDYIEGILTFNEDGTADALFYSAHKIETNYYTQEEIRYADVEDTFADTSSQKHYDSFEVVKEKEKFVIYLFKDGKRETTVKVSTAETGGPLVKMILERDGGKYVLSYSFFEDATENTEITTLPSKDWSK